MPDPSFWSHLRETRLVQALAVYLAGAWVAVQAVSIFAEAFDWPKWVMRGTIVLLALGLVVTLLLVWMRARAADEEAGGGPPPRQRNRIAAVVTASLLLSGVALYIIIQDRGRSLGPSDALAESAAPGIAILPFSVNDPELDRWREGLVDLLATNLDGAGGLRAIDSRTVMARWRQQVEADETPDLATALAIGRQSGGRYAVVGSAVSSGTNMRVVADLYDLESGEGLGQEQVEGAPDSIFKLVDRLSVAILGRILEREGTALPRMDLASITTASVPALKAFLEGEVLLRHSDFQAAIPAYERALDADSTFALAAAQVGQAYGWIEGLESGRAGEAFARATRFADRLPPRDADIVGATVLYTQEHPAATQRAKALVEKYPDDPSAWYILGEAYYHLANQTLATRADKDGAFLRAVRLDPTLAPVYIHLLDSAYLAADSAAAAGYLDRYRRLAAGSGSERQYHTTFGLAFGDSLTRRAAFVTFDSLPTALARPIPSHLRHPKFSRVTREVIRRLRARPDFVDPGFVPWMLMNTGQIRELTTLLQGPALPDEVRYILLIAGVTQDIPLPPALVEKELTLTAADSTPGFKHVAATIYGLENGRREGLDAMLQGMAGMVQGIEAAGDSAQAREITAIADLLRGRDAMLRGQPETA
ncbi:MAG: hypothetical protein ABR559_04840 [Gemmatimonadota bacterium]